MALIHCPECGNRASDQAAACPTCGHPIARTTPPQAPQPVALGTQPKSRGLHIIMGLLFGAMGFHNFYAGHNGRGAIKIGLLALSFFMDALTGFRSGFSLVLLVLFSLWAILEVILVRDDAHGVRMN